MKLDGKTITVFGGTGFLGRHVVYALAKTGATIRVATRMPRRAYFLRPAGNVGQVVPLGCDLDNDASVALALSGADVAVNLVGILNQKGKASFERVHVEFASRIAKQAAKAGVRQLIHVSALGASSTGPSKYLKSKAAGEEKALAAFPAATILRPSVIFGPDDKFFNMFGAMARRSHCLPLIGGGKTKMQPVYVGDVAQAIYNLVAGKLPAGENPQGVFELGGPHVYSFRELMQIVKEQTRQDACLMSLPVPVAKVIGAAACMLPQPPLTVDQVRSLGTDNVLHLSSRRLEALGVTPTAVESVVPSYLCSYRPGGIFGEKKKVS
ncbi:MAG: NAD(P)H-binding protein [Alphaproteobacteria bacterium]|nr:NAD(P)H-binding protein [Alphaproteobacteria bacterium]